MNESSGEGTLLSTDMLLETLQTVRALPLPPKAFLLYKQRCLPHGAGSAATQNPELFTGMGPCDWNGYYVSLV